MEPTLLTVCAIMWPRRAAHLQRYTDGESKELQIALLRGSCGFLVFIVALCYFARPA